MWLLMPDVADSPLLPKPLRDADDLPAEDAVKIRLGVDVVDHADVETVRPQLLQLKVERREGFLPGRRVRQVLPVLPGRAEVSLNDEVPAAAFERRARCSSAVRDSASRCR